MRLDAQGCSVSPSAPRSRCRPPPCSTAGLHLDAQALERTDDGVTRP